MKAQFKNDFHAQRYDGSKQFVVVKKGASCAWLIGSHDVKSCAEREANSQYKFDGFEYLVMDKDEWFSKESGDGNWYFQREIKVQLLYVYKADPGIITDQTKWLMVAGGYESLESAKAAREQLQETEGNGLEDFEIAYPTTEGLVFVNP